MLFNTIVAPCLATMIASSDCFYYVFASPSMITASYSFVQCVDFGSTGCIESSTTTRSLHFCPPFNYNYQCSSALLVDYAYVFAYKYVLIGFLYPAIVLGIVLYIEWEERCSDRKKMEIKEGLTGTEDEQEKDPRKMIGWPRRWLKALLPAVWRVGEAEEINKEELSGSWKREDSDSDSKLVVENPLTSLSSQSEGESVAGFTSQCPSPSNSPDPVTSVTTPAFLLSHHTLAPSKPFSDTLFDSGDYAVRITMMMGCLLTFGAVLPYLAILIAFSIASNTYITKLGWLRVIEMSTSVKNRETLTGAEVEGMDSGGCREKKELVGRKPVALVLGEQCERIHFHLSRAGHPLCVLVPLFYACYLFDTAADGGGGWMGLYFVLGWVGAVGIVWGGIGLWLRYRSVKG
eukprot:scaffold4011_cov197-Ochromonas_danica.AAC.29